VTKIINVGAKLDSSRRAVNITKEIPYCYATAGIHPHHADEFPELDVAEQELSTMIEEDKTNDHKIVAIGECGLDYHEYLKGETHITIDENNKEKQKVLFMFHLYLAQKFHLPLIIHCRDAYQDLLSLIHTPPGVIHCFQGTLADLKQFLDLGFYIGYDGYITYAKNYEELVRTTPLDRILTETDAPWLTPVPHRGKRNTPANIKIITQKIAEIKKLSFEEVDKITTENAIRLFPVISTY
jgi:TatD DNase family protein